MEITSITDLLNQGDEIAVLIIPFVVGLLILVVGLVAVRIKRRRDQAQLNLLEIPEPQEERRKPSTPSASDSKDSEKTPELSKDVTLSLVDEVRNVGVQDWRQRLKAGLTRTRQTLQNSLGALFSGSHTLDEATLEKVHEALFRADFGVKTTDVLVEAVRSELGKAETTDWTAVQNCIRFKIVSIFDQHAKPMLRPESGPWVILIVGVNGVGKTTTISKLAAHFMAEGKSVLLCAGDTFRAAAIEQLQVWGSRLGVDVIAHQQGSDPAAVAFDGVKAAKARGIDVLLIDTAGRLHNKQGLMAELAKINRSVAKELPGAPHETWLVVDATTGQNAVQQVRAFKEVVALTGLVVTKLDGTAKGGVVIGIVDQFGLPIRFLGVGEKAADLRGFNSSDFVESVI